MEEKIQGNWRIVSNNKMLCSMGDNIFSYHAGVLYMQKELYGRPKKLVELPIGTIKRLLSKVRFIERAMRLEPRLAIPLNEESILLSYQGKIYNINFKEPSFKIEHEYRLGMNNTLNFCIAENRIIYGEYFGNPKHEPVRIFERQNNGIWSEIFEFNAGIITHIHGIVYDKYRQCFWILTGDTDDESGIWCANLDFSSVNSIYKGKQKYRSDFIVPIKNGLLYTTDTPLENNGIFFIELRDDGSWKEPQKIKDIPGPCIYGKVLDEKRIIFSTTVEPDSSLPVFRYRLTRKLGAGVKNRYSHVLLYDIDSRTITKLASFKKDFWKIWLFQFGNILFPNINSKHGILCTGQAVKKIDGKSILLNPHN